MKKASANLDTEGLPIVSKKNHAPGYFHESLGAETLSRIVSSLLARLSSKLVG
jgi:hypothetical protein